MPTPTGNKLSRRIKNKRPLNFYLSFKSQDIDFKGNVASDCDFAKSFRKTLWTSFYFGL